MLPQHALLQIVRLLGAWPRPTHSNHNNTTRACSLPLSTKIRWKYGLVSQTQLLLYVPNSKPKASQLMSVQTPKKKSSQLLFAYRPAPCSMHCIGCYLNHINHHIYIIYIYMYVASSIELLSSTPTTAIHVVQHQPIKRQQLTSQLFLKRQLLLQRHGANHNTLTKPLFPFLICLCWRRAVV